MTTKRTGRPEGESQAAGSQQFDRNGHGRHGRGADLLAQLRRRYEAAKRLPPMGHSGRRDPLPARERP